MKKQNVGEKYLTQKKVTPLEIVFIVITVIGALLFLMYWRYYGVPALVIGVAGLIFTMSAQIKDAEFDALIDRILIEKKIELQKENLISAFDSEREPRAVGKDKKVRTAAYYIAELKYKAEQCEVTLHELDLCKLTASEKKYVLPYTSKAELEEKEIMTSIGRKKVYHLVVADQFFRIPVESISIDVDNFIDHFAK